MPPDDPELAEYLAGNTPLSRDYAALGREQPPASVDARVRAEAADAVRPRRVPGRSLLWWLRPAALAATVVLAVSLVLRLGEAPVQTATSPQTRPPVQVQLHAAEPMARESPNMAMSANAPPSAVPAPAYAADEATASGERESRLAPGRPSTPSPAKRAPDREPPPTDLRTVAPPGPATHRPLAQGEGGLTAITASATTPAIEPDRFKRCLTAIRARLAAPEPAATADTASAKVAAKTEAEGKSAESRLRAILALHDAGKDAAAAAALADFARDFPDDPVAMLLTGAMQ